MSQDVQIEHLAELARHLNLRRLRAGNIEVEPRYDEDEGEDNTGLDLSGLFGESDGQAAE